MADDHTPLELLEAFLKATGLRHKRSESHDHDEDITFVHIEVSAFEGDDLPRWSGMAGFKYNFTFDKADGALLDTGVPEEG